LKLYYGALAVFAALIGCDRTKVPDEKSAMRAGFECLEEPNFDEFSTMYAVYDTGQHWIVFDKEFAISTEQGLKPNGGLTAYIEKVSGVCDAVNAEPVATVVLPSK
jgi:hypothetical protein